MSAACRGGKFLLEPKPIPASTACKRSDRNKGHRAKSPTLLTTAAHPMKLPSVKILQCVHIQTLSIFGHATAIKFCVFSRLAKGAHLYCMGLSGFGVRILESPPRRP